MNIEELINAYYKTGYFEFVEPDYIGSGAGNNGLIPNDSYFYRQWSLRNDGSYPFQKPGKTDADIDMDEAWELEQGSSSIIVAILDSGCKLDHSELSGRIWHNENEVPDNDSDDDGNDYVDDCYGWNFVSAGNIPMDDNGHGTNVAGIIGSNGNNQLGYAGIDWNCKLMICKVLDSENSGYYSWWASAIYYAVNNGAHVINMSLGGNSYSHLLKTAIDYAHASGVMMVVSMMNENNSVDYYPAAFDECIAVGATDSDDSRVSAFSWNETKGSNYGNHIDVSAPGHYIYGLYHKNNDDYTTYWGGTSQAAPHVTGLVALLLAQNFTRSNDQIMKILSLTSDDQVGKSSEDTPGWDIYHGHGRINAFVALNYFWIADTTLMPPTEIELVYEEIPHTTLTLHWKNPSTYLNGDTASVDYTLVYNADTDEVIGESFGESYKVTDFGPENEFMFYLRSVDYAGRKGKKSVRLTARAGGYLTGEEIQKTPVPRTYASIAWDGSNILGINDEEGIIDKINVNTGTVVSSNPFTGDRTLGAVWLDNSIWVHEYEQGKIVRYRLNGSKISEFDHNITTNSSVFNGRGLTWDGINFWIGDKADKKAFHLFDISGIKKKTVYADVTVYYCRGIEWIDNQLWVLDGGLKVLRIFELNPDSSLVQVSQVNDWWATWPSDLAKTDSIVIACDYQSPILYYLFPGRNSATSLDIPKRISSKEFKLHQNYPNPFNPYTIIEFALSKPINVKIKIYNTLGQKIQLLLDKNMEAGIHRIRFSTNNLPSGIYFYRIEAGNFHEVKKMVLLR